MPENTLLAYPFTSVKLDSIANAIDFPFSNRPGSGLHMAFDLHDRLEKLGPIRFISAQVNGEFGVAWLLGQEEEEVELSSIPTLLLSWTEAIFGKKPLLFTRDQAVEDRYTAPNKKGGVDVLLVGTEVK